MAKGTNMFIDWGPTPLSIGVETAAGPAAVSPKVAEKRNNLMQAAELKKAIYGSPEEMRRAATASVEETLLSQQEQMRDLDTLGDLEFAAKYGFQAAKDRWQYFAEKNRIRRLKDRERTTSGMMGDTALDLINGVGQLGAGAAQLGATLNPVSRAIDAVAGTDITGMNQALVADAATWLNDTVDEHKTQTSADRDEQANVQRQLLAEDRAVRDAERRANADPDSTWESVVAPKLAEWGEQARDAVSVVGSDPILLGEFATESAASLGGMGKAVSIAGKASTMRVLASRGIVGKEAKDFLRTDAGKKLLAEQSTKVAPVVAATFEDGAAINQTVQDVLSMDEATLSQSEEYQALRKEGKSHEAARQELAGDAGFIAGLTAAPIAIAGGKLAADVVASPLRFAPKNAVFESFKNIGKETVEEAMQEGGSQFAGNVGVNAIGLDRALDEGVAEAAALGAMGGAMSSGMLQSPGMSIQLAGKMAEGAVKGTVAAAGAVAGPIANRISAAQEAKKDTASPVGTPARQKAAETITKEVEAITTPVAEAAPVEGSEAAPDLSEGARNTLRDSAFLKPEEVANLAASEGSVVAKWVAENPGKAVPRAVAIEDLGNTLTNITDDVAQVYMAVGVIDQISEMRKAASTSVETEVTALPEGHAHKASFAAIQDQVRVYEKSPMAAKATEVIQKLTPEKTRQLFSTDMLKDPNLPDADRISILSAVKAISSLNPEAVRDIGIEEIQDMPLGQTMGSAYQDALKELKEAKAVIDLMDRTDATRQEIIEKSKTSKRPNGVPTMDMVRNDIHSQGNTADRDALPSLMKHRTNVILASRGGDQKGVDRALGALHNFAQTLANKIGALNESVAEGGGKDSKKGYEAFGRYGAYDREAKSGVWVDPANPGSVAFANLAWNDARAAVELSNMLQQEYAAQADPITLPDLDPSVQMTEPTPTAPAKPEAAAEAREAAPKAEKKKKKETKAKAEPKPKAEVEPKAEPAPAKEPEPVKAPDPVVQEEVVQPDPEAEPDVAEVDEPSPAPEPEAASEPTSEDDTEVEDAPSVSWMARLKDLLVKSVDGANRFLDNFRPAKRGSTLLQHDLPVEWLLENIGEMGFNAEQEASVSYALEKIYPAFEKAMQASADKLVEARTKNGKTLGDLLRLGTNMLPLNFLVQDEDGNTFFEPAVVSAVFMATMEWMARNSGPRRAMDDEQINKMFGRPRTAFVTEELREAAGFGVGLQQSIQDIASKSMALLDVAPKKDAQLKYAQGMFQSLAANALETIMTQYEEKSSTGSNGRKITIPTNDVAKAGWVDRVMTRVNTGGQTRDLMSIRPSKMFAGNDRLAALRSMRDPFSRIFMKDGQRERYIGTAPKTPASTILRNKIAKLSQAERDVVKRLQNTPHRLNMPMVELTRMLGTDGFLRLLGHTDLSEERDFNIRDLMSRKGKNETLTHDLDALADYILEMEQVAETEGKDLSEIEAFFDWEVSSVGRMQQVGSATPQGSKLFREMLSATRSVIDTTVPEAVNALRLAIAQSIGVKVEKLTTDQVMEASQKLLDGSLKPALDLLQAMARGEPLDPVAFERALVNSGETITPKLIHALLTEAQLRETKDPSKFETFLALEADGKTDGPVNAMIHMAHGAFTPEDIERFAMGGFFFTDIPLSLNDYIEFDKLRDPEKGGQDIYHKVAESFQQALISKGISKEAAPVLRLLDRFLDGFSLNAAKDGTFDPIVGRDVVKNPTTVFLYGSGVGGISGKIANAVFDNLGLALTEQIMTGKQLPNSVKRDLADVLFNGDGRALMAWLKDPSKAASTAEMYATFSAQIEEHFAKEMMAAIDNVTGGLGSNMQTLQKVASVQNLIFKDLFTQRLAAAQAAKPKGTDLTEQEILDIYIDTMDVAPIYETDVHSFHISKPQNQPDFSKPVSASFSDRLTGYAAIPEPNDASVKVSPYLTIGSGDGRMILNIYRNGDGSFDTSLPVFDGVELAVDQAMAGSQQINREVYSGWMDNVPMEAVLAGYDQMLKRLRSSDFNSMSEETKKELFKALKLDRRDALTIAHIRALRTDLKELVLGNKARKIAMAKMATSTDHMASAQQPYAHAGELAVEGGSPFAFEAIALRLEELRQEALKELEAADARTAPKEGLVAGYAAPPTKKFTGSVRYAGEPVKGHKKVRSMTGKAAADMVLRSKDSTPDQKGIIRELLEIGAIPDDAIFYFGEAKDLEALRDDPKQEHLAGLPKAPIELGQTFSQSGVAFIANGSNETTLHELVHMFTARLIQNHYRNPEASPEHVAFAVQRLEELVDEVMELMPTDGPTHRREALLHLQKEIRNARAKGDRLTPVMELIAYSLSNQDIITSLKEARTFTGLRSVVQKALRAFKKLLGIKGGPGMTLYSNIRFNTKLLVSSPSEVQKLESVAAVEQVLAQSFGTDARIQALGQLYFGKLRNYWKSQKTGHEKYLARAELEKLRTRAQGVAGLAKASDFVLGVPETHLFDAIHATASTGFLIEPALEQDLYKALSHVMDVLKPEDFLEVWGVGSNPTAADKAKAERMVNFLIQARSLRQGANGRSDLLATFLGLSQTSEDLRGVLARMPTPKKEKLPWNTVGNWMANIGNALTDMILMKMTSASKDQDMIRRFDRLAETLGQIQEKRKEVAIIAKAGKMAEQANDYVAGKIDAAGTALTKGLESRANANQGTKKGKAFNIGAFVTSVISAGTAEEYGHAMTKMLNEAQGKHTLRSLLNELRGMTKDNAPLLRLLNPTKYKAEALRQDFREGVPKNLTERFKKRPSRTEWAHMSQGIAKTDLSALGLSDALSLLTDPSTMPALRASAEGEVQKLGGKNTNLYIAKAEALATWMIKGQNTSRNLLPNALAIAHLLGEPKARVKVTDELVTAIDRLTTLLAFEQLDPAVVKTLSTLAQNEPDGLRAVTGFANTMRMQEMEALKGKGKEANVARFNGWKGYIPSVVEQGHEITVEDDLDRGYLESLGYVRVGTYAGDRAEGVTHKRGYYKTSVGGKNAFRQGIAQTVHETWQGVDRMNGRTLSGTMAGTVLGNDASDIVKAVYGMTSRDKLNPGDYLIPRFNSNGSIIAYERPMAPEKLDMLPKDNHLGRMLGVWAGRVYEESVAQETNSGLMTVLKEIYAEDMKAGRANEYVNLADPALKDPVHRDVWKTLSWPLKEMAKEAFGENEFWVRKDMIDDAVGYRAAGLTDAWTGVTRFSPEAQKRIREVATLMMGPKAYKYLKMTEDQIQGFVSLAKSTIIVRSVVVGVGNIASNMLHLSIHGIAPHTIAIESAKKLKEINAFVKNREEIQKLQVALYAVSEEPEKVARLRARIQALDEANGRLTIAPLIEAGEFSTISENLTEDDVAIREGRWADHIEKVAERVPEWAQNATKNLLLTKDSEVYQSLNRLVQYGDFVAKAVLYDHLTKKKGKPQREVMDTIFEEFVPYNRLPGRGRDFLESMGLMWFWNYKLRITKVLLNTLRERPLTGILTMMQAGPHLGVDTVFDGSVLGNAADGSWSFSLGPMMGIQAPTLHPVWAATS